MTCNNDCQNCEHGVEVIKYYCTRLYKRITCNRDCKHCTYNESKIIQYICRDYLKEG